MKIRRRWRSLIGPNADVRCDDLYGNGKAELHGPVGISADFELAAERRQLRTIAADMASLAMSPRLHSETRPSGDGRREADQQQQGEHWCQRRDNILMAAYRWYRRLPEQPRRRALVRLMLLRAEIVRSI